MIPKWCVDCLLFILFLFVCLLFATEERFALFTLRLILVDELIEGVEAWVGSTVNVVPPVTDEVLLVEDGTVGAQEAVGVTIGLAHVKDLGIGKNKHVEDVIWTSPFSISRML